MAVEASGSWNSKGFLASGGRATLCRKGRVIFSQGDSADAAFYIEKGKVKLTTVSAQAKEAVLGLLGSDHAGERDAAGLASHRMIRQRGLTWQSPHTLPATT